MPVRHALSAKRGLPPRLCLCNWDKRFNPRTVRQEFDRIAPARGGWFGPFKSCRRNEVLLDVRETPV